MADWPFQVRQKHWGQWRVRSGLPRVESFSGNANAVAIPSTEILFYHLVLKASLLRGDHYARVWDVGCRNWSYVGALAEFFPEARLHGIELDGGRRYWNLYRRCDYARAHANAAGSPTREVKVFEGDFAELSPEMMMGYKSEELNLKYLNICVLFFFPFVSERPCRKWGIPTQYADFARLLRPISNNVCWTDVMSCHQGEWEAEIARAAYVQVGRADFREVVLSPDTFRNLWPSPHPVHVLSHVKEGLPR